MTIVRMLSPWLSRRNAVAERGGERNIRMLLVSLGVDPFATAP